MIYNEKLKKYHTVGTFLKSNGKVWRYQSGYHMTSIEDGQTILWPKEKGQRDKQWSTKHYTENL